MGSSIALILFGQREDSRTHSLTGLGGAYKVLQLVRPQEAQDLSPALSQEAWTLSAGQTLGGLVVESDLL